MVCGMSVGASLQLFYEFGNPRKCVREYKSSGVKNWHHLSAIPLSSRALRQDTWNLCVSDKIHKSTLYIPYRYNAFTCRSSAIPNPGSGILFVKNTTLALTRKPLFAELVPAIGVIAFAAWGLVPLLRSVRSLFYNDGNWKKSKTYYISTSYLRPLLLWTGATLICRVLDPVVLSSEASQAVKQRILNFVRSLSTVLAFAYCLTSLIQHTQKLFVETSGTDDARKMGYEFAGKAIYTAVWVAAVSLFMELLGFSTQKWITAGGLGTVLLTLAGREIFTNFLSSVMIHATRPFVVNEWIQTKIEGYEVSGTVEHVGWWSPTIIRGDDREAVHIPNHKFTVNVVRNLSQKTHWRIKTHLAISHLDVNKISNIVADMRKVLAKNHHIEQQRLHRRVFLDNIDPENQALLVLVSCFVRTSHFEEYLCVKEAVLLDLLRVISHHRARLATPIRTVQRVYTDPEITNIPFAENVVDRSATSANRPYLLIGPTTKVNGEEKTKPRSSSRANEDQAGKSTISEVKVTTPPEGAVLNSSDKQQDKKTNSGDALHRSAKSDTVEAPSPNFQSAGDLENLETVGTGTKGPSHKATVSEGATEQADVSSPVQVKNDAEKLPATTSAARSAFEDNIVLGVALEGSKRTLPIEEGLSPSSTQLEGNELTAGRAGNASSTSAKDKKGSVPSDHRDQER